MVLLRVHHRKGSSTSLPIAPEQPFFIVSWRVQVLTVEFSEFADDLGDQMDRQTVQIILDRMSQPIPLPIVVYTVLDGFVLAVNVVCQQALDSLVLGKGDVRTEIKRESRGQKEGCGVTAILLVLIVERDLCIHAGQPVGRTETSHTRSQNRDFFRHAPTPRKYAMTSRSP